MSIKNYYKKLLIFDGKIGELAANYRIPAAILKVDCILSRVIDGTNPDQYFAFQFYKLRRRERNLFVTKRRSNRIERVFNHASDSEIEIIANKALFNKTFDSFIHRDWVYVPDASENEVRAFVERNRKILIKPTHETQGKGIRLLKEEDLKNGVSAFYQEAKKEGLLLEEFITQHPALSKINPSSVNTARICTVRDRDGNVHVIGASLRGGGKKSVVDNLHAAGVQYPVDVATGIIIRGGVKNTGEQNIYFHPDTNVQMIGMQIPNWSMILQTVREAGQSFPSLRYIGWDIAITETGCELVEANIQQGSNGMQQDGVGKYPIIMQYL
jgi:hypothetical protein